MKYHNIIKKVAEEMNLPEELISRTYDSYWLFIRNTIQEIPLKEELTEEDFGRFKTNFNIPSIGKLSCTYNRYKSIKNQFKKFKDLQDVYNKESKTPIQ